MKCCNYGYATHLYGAALKPPPLFRATTIAGVQQPVPAIKAEHYDGC